MMKSLALLSNNMMNLST